MIKGFQIAVLTVAGLLLLGVSLLNVNQEVRLRVWFFMPAQELSLGLAILVFFVLGVIVTVILTLLDRAQLRSQNKKLQHETEKLQQEIKSLRQIATMEKDPE